MKVRLMFLIPFLLAASKASAELTKCLDQIGHVRYVSNNDAEKKSLMGKGFQCEVILRDPTSEEVKARNQAIKRNYQEQVRETARFLDDVEAARKKPKQNR